MASPEYDRLIAQLRATDLTAISPIEESRTKWEAFAGTFSISDDVCFEPVDARGVESEWITTPETDPNRVVIYLHGGGYNIGTIKSYRSLGSRLARASKARLLLVGYRLAPEHPCPAAVEDAVTAYRWLLEDQGIAPSSIVIGGDSAGGGLVISMAAVSRDAGLPMPAALFAISPSTDLAKEGKSVTERAHLDPIISYESSMGHAMRYVGPGGDLKNPLASPLYADLRGLPPLLMLAGTYDTLFDDATRVADKAKAAGVEVELDVWEEMVHSWPLFADLIPEGRAAIEKIGGYVQRVVP
ncbi:alpha/beta hydrolase [Sphingobium sp. EM0848]|uniref:alpha/beta hydrolase n=1 Tax=Sphingobium sp. EM0848 TaxID=2743473 RepID=UPI00159C9FD6|nr:alpha/beta hydrolase [Sphingobium sp. EM0848]